MQNINNEWKNPRGSSPPFQQLEKWIDDEAKGSRWVKMYSIDSQRQADQTGESLDRELDVLLPAEGNLRWEDNSGNRIESAKHIGD